MSNIHNFRVYDTVNKEYSNYDFYMCRYGHLYYRSITDKLVSLTLGNRYIVERCTGLKDKNGKLIFEGDVITTADDDEIPKEYDIYCIKWAKAYSGELFCAIDKKGELQDFYGGISLLEYVRIIGNIHQMEVEK